MKNRARRLGATVVAVTLAAGSASSVLAAPLAPGGNLAPLPGEVDPTGFTHTSDVLVGNFNAPGLFSGAVLSQVYFNDASNPLGGLTFTYTLFNDSTSNAALAQLSLDTFAGLGVDASYQTPTAASWPARADRNSAGNMVNFTFSTADGGGPVAPGQVSGMMVIQTNATEFASVNAALINGSAGGLIYAPTAVPEPASLGLVAVAGAALLRRRSR